MGAARNWIKWHRLNGDQVTWSSTDVLQPAFTVADVEALAAHVAAAAMAPQPSETEIKRYRLRCWELERQASKLRSEADLIRQGFNIAFEYASIEDYDGYHRVAPYIDWGMARMKCDDIIAELKEKK